MIRFAYEQISLPEIPTRSLAGYIASFWLGNKSLHFISQSEIWGSSFHDRRNYRRPKFKVYVNALLLSRSPRNKVITLRPFELQRIRYQDCRYSSRRCGETMSLNCGHQRALLYGKPRWIDTVKWRCSATSSDKGEKSIAPTHSNTSALDGSEWSASRPGRASAPARRKILCLCRGSKPGRPVCS
jgi:hypothetical protein